MFAGRRTGTDTVPEPNECEAPEPDRIWSVELDQPWWAQARCNDATGAMNALFFSGRPQDIARAKHICATCPVMDECLEGALERREPFGVWGGQLLQDGMVLQIKRRRGRPPKVARPEDQQPDIRVPDHLRDLVVLRFPG